MGNATTLSHCPQFPRPLRWQPDDFPVDVPEPEPLTIFEVHRRLRLAYRNQEIAMSTMASAKRKLKRMGTTMQSVLTDASNFVRKNQEDDDSSDDLNLSDLEASSGGSIEMQEVFDKRTAFYETGI